MVGVAHKGVSFAISCAGLPDGGRSSASEHCRALGRFFRVVEPSEIEAAVADREFISARWLSWLQAREIPFVVRLRSDRHVVSPGGTSLPARVLALRQVKVLDREHFLRGADGDSAEVRIGLKRIADRSSDTSGGEDPFLILATSGVDPAEATGLYRERWQVETVFAALKSRGCNLERTLLTEPDRVQRLIGLLALAFGWTWARPRAKSKSRGAASQKNLTIGESGPIPLWSGSAPKHFGNPGDPADRVLRRSPRT